MSEQDKNTFRMLETDVPINPAVFDGLYTDDYLYHGIPMIGELKGPTVFRDMLVGFVGSISDFREEVADQIAEGDKVVTRIVGSGRHTAELMGVALTGKETSWTADHHQPIRRWEDCGGVARVRCVELQSATRRAVPVRSSRSSPWRSSCDPATTSAGSPLQIHWVSLRRENHPRPWPHQPRVQN